MGLSWEPQLIDSIWEYWNQLGPLANFIQIVGAMLSAGYFVYVSMKRRLDSQGEIQRNLEEALLARRKQIDDLQQELFEARKNDPEKWLADAVKERRENNEEKAVDALVRGIARTEKLLYQVYLEVARCFVALYPDQGGVLQLQEAQRAAHIAVLMNSEARAAAVLLSEIGETLALNDIQKQQYRPSIAWTNTPITAFLSELSTAPGASIEALLNAANMQEAAGRYAIVERLCYRARCIAFRWLGSQDKAISRIRLKWAHSLHLIGANIAALEELDEMLQIQWAPKEARQEFVISARTMRIHVLDALGKFSEALAECNYTATLASSNNDELNARVIAINFEKGVQLFNLGRLQESLITIEAVLNSLTFNKAEDTEGIRITARSKYATVLSALGENERALEEISSVLQMRLRINGLNHPDTLIVRSVRAGILEEMNKLESAYEEIEDVVKQMSDVLGESHPATLVTKYDYCRLLLRLDRLTEALTCVDSLLPDRIRVSGLHHIDTLATRRLRLQILSELKDFDQVITESSLLIDAQSKGVGGHVLEALLLRYERAKAMRAVSNFQEALNELDELIPTTASVFGLVHKNTLSDKKLRAFVLLDLGRKIDASKAIIELISEYKSVGRVDTVTELETLLSSLQK